MKIVSLIFVALVFILKKKKKVSKFLFLWISFVNRLEYLGCTVILQASYCTEYLLLIHAEDMSSVITGQRIHKMNQRSEISPTSKIRKWNSELKNGQCLKWQN